ncbi:MAG TPA: S-layer homology domain-containing protein [Acidimicrobiia bacterium]|nr:S-layer homology domain-containing protein [Acidimicrobiia bacterium]
MALAVLALFILATPSWAAGISGAFTDDDGSVHEADINGIAEAGITKGCGGTNFCPRGGVTRAEMASFLVRAMELTPQTTGPFTDITNSIHAPNINALAAAGITAGCSANAYCPDQVVSREQMATFLTRALELIPTQHNFADVGTGAHAQDIGAIAAAGITTGCGPGLYCPFDWVTREQMATFLVRGFEIPRVYPQIPLLVGTNPSCTKDGLSCFASIVVPFRGLYEVREGFYAVSDPESLNSTGTRVEILLNGFSVGLESLPVPEGGVALERMFKGTTTLAPGTHRFEVRWFWNGVLEQTTTVSVTVRT